MSEEAARRGDHDKVLTKLGTQRSDGTVEHIEATVDVHARIDDHTGLVRRQEDG